MSIKLGDIDVAQEIVELNFQLRRTQLLLDVVIAKMVTHPPYSTLGALSMNSALGLYTSTPPALTPEEVSNVDRMALTWLKEKFPNMGITANSSTKV